MAYSKIEQTVYDIALPVAEENGCSVYDIEYVKEGGARYLRVYIDKDGGVSLDDCEAVSRRMSECLDEVDPIKENYILEVASPGIERKLRQPEHFEMYKGREVNIGLYKAIGGSKMLHGVLEGYEDKTVCVNADGEIIKLALGDTSYVRLHFDF